MPKEPDKPGAKSEGRSSFAPGELASVCARYDIGKVLAVRELARGGAASPKAIITSSAGLFFLKRRAPGHDDPRRVALSHHVMLYLRSRGYPAPELVGTRGENNSMLQIGAAIYELFRYVSGAPYSCSAGHAAAAGAALAALHQLLAEFAASPSAAHHAIEDAHGSYHAAPAVAAKLRKIPRRLGSASARRLVHDLIVAYENARALAQRRQPDWAPPSLVHGDWHPGNLLFRADPGQGGAAEVVGVFDFDAVRPGLRVVDAANGALQFALKRDALADARLRRVVARSSPQPGPRTTNPTTAPRTSPPDSEQNADGFRFSCYRAFLRGYHQSLPGGLRPGELASIPWLMIEAMIAEASVTIEATGRFGSADPIGVLQVVLSTSRWIADRAAELTES